MAESFQPVGLQPKGTALVHSYTPEWYDPIKIIRENKMNTDALGRLIKVNDVCGFASRRGSTTSLDVVVVREVKPAGIKGDKIVREYVVGPNGGWTAKLVPTHLIRRPEHLIITGVSEAEAMSLMKVRR